MIHSVAKIGLIFAVRGNLKDLSTMDKRGIRNLYPSTTSFWLLLLLLQLVSQAVVAGSSWNYLVGLGSYDITGPAADVNMMGYANTGQNAAGVHIRLRARVFIVADFSSTSGAKRVVFVNLDACMASMAVTLRVISRLKERYGDLYTAKNVAMSGTHTHSGPGGYLQYVLYLVTSLGFVRQSFEALVYGIELAIVEAHENLRPGSLFLNKGDVLGANINRSPSSYLNNPAEERANYEYDVDKEMSLLKFVDAELGPVGAFSWFPVHGTSMNRTNHLISGDNKGAAARSMEDWFGRLQKTNSNTSKMKSFGDASAAEMPGPSGGQPSSRLSSVMHKVRSKLNNARSKGSLFVAAFCQGNVGDTTPNTLGPFCMDSGLPCDFHSSTCNGKSQQCVGRGPAFPGDHFESTRIVGEKQAGVAIKLFQEAKVQVLGKISYKQTYVNMTRLSVKLPSGEVVSTCPAAVGFSFAAGTTDGPGAFGFTQGDNQGNLFWRLVGGALHRPSMEQINCHKPKPILLDTGDMFRPYAWAPSVLPIQILQIGQFIILSVPGEMTTMAGRRLRAAVKATLVEKGRGQFDSNTQIIIAGLAGDYSQYITTFEEYQVQRYEGASTLFGPHTLEGYIQEFKKLATALAQDGEVAAGPPPPNLLDQQYGFLPGVVADRTPAGVTFGDLKQDVPPNAAFRKGETVAVVFYSGSPRNDLLTEGTFALVEMLDSAAQWQPVYDDDDWSVKFLWSRPSRFSATSLGRIEWTIPVSALPGVYRIRHFGAYKLLVGAVNHFTGTSSGFRVIA